MGNDKVSSEIENAIADCTLYPEKTYAEICRNNNCTYNGMRNACLNILNIELPKRENKTNSKETTLNNIRMKIEKKQNSTTNPQTLETSLKSNILPRSKAPRKYKKSSKKQNIESPFSTQLKTSLNDRKKSKEEKISRNNSNDSLNSEESNLVLPKLTEEELIEMRKFHNE